MGFGWAAKKKIYKNEIVDLSFGYKRWESQLRWFRRLIWMPPGRLCLEAFQRYKASSSEQSDIAVLLQDLSLRLTDPVFSNVEAFGLVGGRRTEQIHAWEKFVPLCEDVFYPKPCKKMSEQNVEMSQQDNVPTGMQTPRVLYCITVCLKCLFLIIRPTPNLR